jgi:hypothetical protein
VNAPQRSSSAVKIDLLPPPKKLRLTGGKSGATRFARRIVSGLKSPEAYNLVIDRSGLLLEAETDSGFFHGKQTLAQLRAQFGSTLPCLRIVDWPDFPVRGFYHDVTRGKVPTLRTLLQLAERCARHKLNHLELYIEHTYAFRNHPEVWRGADPLTRDEILALDARCAELHIDLVPSFATFGHMYTWMRNEFPELNELEVDASRVPYSWRDRMQHYTLDCQNPRSIELVREIIREVRPLFRSRYFNICADETFDLGNGRNKPLADKIGKGQLYVEFLNQIMALVREAGATPLFWGDVISHHPEVIDEIGADAIALDWDYDGRPSGSRARLLAQAGRRFYVCPGTSAWEGWLPHFRKGYDNITRFTKHALNHGASGLLNTDWGDFGHIGGLGLSFPGLALGAACGWNVRSGALNQAAFAETISQTLLGDATGKLYGALSDYASLRKASWFLVIATYHPHTPHFPEDWFGPDRLPRELFKQPRATYERALAKMQKLAPQIERVLTRAKPDDALLAAEIRLGLLGQQLMEELFLCYFERSGRRGRLSIDPRATARKFAAFARQLRSVWLRRNKPSELWRIEEVLGAAQKDLESMAPARAKKLKTSASRVRLRKR